MEVWCGQDYAAGDFPVAEQAATEVLSLPLYAELRPESVNQIATHVREFVLAEGER
jgi:dTDP-4-amino-4,6-dideoxygalactose transaminase